MIEFIEHPNKHNISCSTSVVKMWVLFEGSRRPLKLSVDTTKVTNLNEFTHILMHDYEELKNTRPQNIEFLGNNNEPYLPDTDLQTLAKKISPKEPLVVRYPISDLSIKVNFRFTCDKGGVYSHVPHSSDLFGVLQESAKKAFKEKLGNIPANILYFEYYNDKIFEEQIENMFHMNVLVKEMKEMSQDKNMITIEYLKVQVQNQKPYSDWKIDKVLTDIYKRDTGIPELEFERFDLNSLPPLSPKLGDKELNEIFGQLRDRKLVFRDNEDTAHEFISVFLVNAVKFIIKNNDPEARLKAEINLSGTNGYGLLDYAILFKLFFILIIEAKSNQSIPEGITRNLMQIHIASEVLGKRKLNQVDIKTIPTIGIVTNGTTWVFIRQHGLPAKLEKSDEFVCSFASDNMETEKKVAEYIVRVLQAQIKVLNQALKQNEQSKSKRPCTN